MVRKAYDSVTVSALPTDGDLYLGYVDGRYANVAQIHKRFPRRTVVGITVNGSTLDAQMADVEVGDLTPDGGARWAVRKVKAGQHPTLYTYASNAGAVQRACTRAGLKPSQWSLFVADYDGDPTLPPGCVGKQYRSPDGTGRGKVTDGNYDVSVVADYWPGVDPKPLPKPAATGTPVSRLSLALARRLTARLVKRHKPVTGGRAVLTALDAQIRRVLGLK